MKRIFLSLIAMLAVATTFAQAPQGFTYQAAVRNNDGTAVANQQVSVRISLLQGSALGLEQYVELHSPTTDAAGLFNIVVGQGTSLVNCMMQDCIDWANGPWFLKTQIDPDGGQNFTLSTTQQLMSVPYAIFAANVAHDTVHIRDSVVVHDVTMVHDSVVVHIIDSVVVHIHDSIIIRDSVEIHYDTTAFAADTVWNTDSVEGMLPGRFSVNVLEQVSFASGNLQYRPSDTSWRFAPHQYDALGSINNNHSQSSYTGWLDLRSYTQSNSWCANRAIQGGGDSAGLWRVLSIDEWDYILTERANSSQLRTFATVDGVPGLVLLPDNWQLPYGIAMTISVDSAANSYTVAQWAILEAAGAVFLPAAGYIYSIGSTISNFGTSGTYASETISNYTSLAHKTLHFYFGSSNCGLQTTYTASGSQYISVRPVHDIPRF